MRYAGDGTSGWIRHTRRSPDPADPDVPHPALLNLVHAAPRGTTVRWYDAPHALDRAAYRDAFAWLARKLS